jgi:hypothetical protein
MASRRVDKKRLAKFPFQALDTYVLRLVKDGAASTFEAIFGCSWVRTILSPRERRARSSTTGGRSEAMILGIVLDPASKI